MSIFHVVEDMDFELDGSSYGIDEDKHEFGSPLLGFTLLSCWLSWEVVAFTELSVHLGETVEINPGNILDDSSPTPKKKWWRSSLIWFDLPITLVFLLNCYFSPDILSFQMGHNRSDHLPGWRWTVHRLVNSTVQCVLLARHVLF